MADHSVRSLAVAQSDLRDVMLTIQEGVDPGDATPARELTVRDARLVHVLDEIHRDHAAE